MNQQFSHVPDVGAGSRFLSQQVAALDVEANSARSANESRFENLSSSASSSPQNGKGVAPELSGATPFWILRLISVMATAGTGARPTA